MLMNVSQTMPAPTHAATLTEVTYVPVIRAGFSTPTAEHAQVNELIVRAVVRGV